MNIIYTKIQRTGVYNESFFLKHIDVNSCCMCDNVLFRLAHWLMRRWCQYCTKIIISIVRLLSFCLTTVFHSPDSMLFSESPTPGPLDESLSDLTDVAPSRKRRFRHLRAPEAAVKRPNPETSQRKRYECLCAASFTSRSLLVMLLYFILYSE